MRRSIPDHSLHPGHCFLASYPICVKRYQIFSAERVASLEAYEWKVAPFIVRPYRFPVVT